MSVKVEIVLPVALYERLKKKAEEKGMTVEELVTVTLIKAIEDRC